MKRNKVAGGGLTDAEPRTLAHLAPGNQGMIREVLSVGISTRTRRRLLESGIVPGVSVRLDGYASGGDPVLISVSRSNAKTRMTLSHAEADSIILADPGERMRPVHPAGIPKKKFSSPPPERNGNVTLYLTGNQNTGKSTLFNALTGGNAKTGNYAGVTVEVSRGVVPRIPGITVVDLPGTSSAEAFSPEERAALSVLMRPGDEVGCAVVTANAMSPARSLYFLLRLMKYGALPTVLAVNFSDLLSVSGGKCDTAGLSLALGIPVVAVSAVSGEGIGELISTAGSSARPPLLSAEESGNAFPVPDDDEICSLFALAEKLTEKFFVIPDSAPGSSVSVFLDRIALGKHTALPCFLAAAAVMMLFTFGVGGLLSAFLSDGIDYLAFRIEGLLREFRIPDLPVSFLCDGVIRGVGSVVSFAPTVCALFLFISLLEDTGYMARAAFVAHPLMRRLGLSGRSVIPLISGFGCTVPAVLAARTIPDEKERRLAVFLAPYVTCSAKLPVYVLLCGALFPGSPALPCALICAAGIAVGAVVSSVLRRICPSLNSNGSPLAVEMPDLRVPSVLVVLRSTRDRTRSFLRRAFTVILTASALVWICGYFTPSFRTASSPEDSILFALGSFLSPFFSPLGFGSPAAVAGLISGLFAKEAVISTLTILSDGSPLSVFTPASAAAYLTFVLFYSPCAAANAAVSRESGSKTAVVCALFRTVFAYLSALAVNVLLHSVGIS